MELTLKAHVRGGGLVLNEPIDLPDGVEVSIVVADAEDQQTDAERLRLRAVVQKSLAQIEAGRGLLADDE